MNSTWQLSPPFVYIGADAEAQAADCCTQAGFATGHRGIPTVMSAWRSQGEDVPALSGGTEGLLNVAQLGRLCCD